jgi:hypothetical protein
VSSVIFLLYISIPFQRLADASESGPPDHLMPIVFVQHLALPNTHSLNWLNFPSGGTKLFPKSFEVGGNWTVPASAAECEAWFGNADTNADGKLNTGEKTAFADACAKGALGMPPA